MIRFECTRMAQLIQARTAGLSEANALRLEEHLTHCADCSREAHLLDGLRELSDASADPLTPAARQRVVLQAFARVERAQPSIAPARAWLVPSACGVLLAAAFVAVGIARQPMLGDGAEARVLSGAIERTTRGGETEIATEAGGELALAHAKLELRPRTRARWNERARVLQLESGSVVADVDPAKHQSFRVDTEKFRVFVLGTRFEVSKAEVRVTRGRVRVESPSGAELATLGAGERYECASAPCKARVVPPTAAENAARGEGVKSEQAQGEGAEAESQTREPGHGGADAAQSGRGQGAGSEDVERQLEAARAALGRRDIATARAIVANVLRARLARRDQAEALTLRAECALVAGDQAAASAGYALVAKRFANLPAGENALFASARLDAERLSGPSAEAGLTRYLARYPRGRFVKEATARLQQLRAARPQP